MTALRSDYFISSDPSWLQIEFVVRSLRETYWANQRSEEAIRASLLNSLCFGVYSAVGHDQVGFARVVTDRATFSWLCDVVIDPAHRRRGLGKALVSAVLSHPDLRSTTFHLGTRDAHGLYQPYGFAACETMRRPATPPLPPT